MLAQLAFGVWHQRKAQQPTHNLSRAMPLLHRLCADAAPAFLDKNNLCGDVQKPCPAGYRCFDGFNCCPEGAPVCGGKCCGAPWTCVGNVCVPPGGSPCGRIICMQDWKCLENDLCCRATDTICNHKCCPLGNQCRSGLCVLPDEEPCGLGRTGDTALRMCRLPEEFCADPAKGTPVAACW